MNNLKVNPPVLVRIRMLPHLLSAILILILLSGCSSKQVAKSENKQLFPPGPVRGQGRVVAINPSMEVLTLQIGDRQVPLWISDNTQYFNGKLRITYHAIHPEDDVEFVGWSYGTDVRVRQVVLKSVHN